MPNGTGVTGETFDPTPIQSKLDEVNAALGAVTPFKLALVDPRQVKPAPKNARFMTQAQLRRLTDNIRKDGNLSTLPLLWQDGEGAFHTIGGHHRIEDAVIAQVPAILALYTDAEMTEAERISRQLGDNAIVGQDDPQILAEMYSAISELDWKEYSGLDDAVLNYKPELPELGVGGNMRLEPVTFMLFDDEIERFDDLVKDVNRSPKHKRYGVYDEVWDAFFEALLDYGLSREVVSASTTLAVLTKLARAALCFENDEAFLQSLDAISQISEFKK